LAYNATVILIIGVLPFYANYGFNLKILWEAKDMEYLVKMATVKVEKLKDLYRELFKDIE
jgi:hypothetical protein